MQGKSQNDVKIFNKLNTSKILSEYIKLFSYRKIPSLTTYEMGIDRSKKIPRNSTINAFTSLQAEEILEYLLPFDS